MGYTVAIKCVRAGVNMGSSDEVFLSLRRPRDNLNETNQLGIRLPRSAVPSG